MRVPAVNIIIQDLSNEPVNLTLEEYTETTVNQMKNNGQLPIKNLKVEKDGITLGGLKAAQCEFSAPIEEDLKIKFKQMWTLKEKVAYIFTFSCELQEFKNNLPTVKKMLESFNWIKVKRRIKHVVLKSHLHKSSSHHIALRIPITWTEVPIDAVSALKGYLVHYNFSAKEGKEAPESRINLTVNATPTNKVSMTMRDVSRLVRLQVSRLLPTNKPVIRKCSIGGHPARSVEFASDALSQGDRFMQYHILKNNYIYAISLVANTPENDDDRPFKIFERIAVSFEFLEEDEKPKHSTLSCAENLIHQFGIYFNPQQYIPKEDFLGMTLALIKSTEQEKMRMQGPTYLPVHISLVVRDVENEGITLDAICDELKEEAKRACEDLGQQFNITQEETVEVGGVEGRLLKIIAPFYSPAGPDRRHVMQRFTLKDGMAVLLSFSALEQSWKEDSPHATKYINTFYFF